MTPGKYSNDGFDDLAAELGGAITKANEAEKAGAPEAKALRAEADRLKAELLRAAGQH